VTERAALDKTDELIECRLVAFDVEEKIVGLVHFRDRVCELPATPILLPMNASAGALDHASIALHHRGHLFALVRMNQKHDFVVSQSRLLSG
jgi:hypothetical protein